MGSSSTKRDYRRNASNPLPGLYRARVEYRNDPDKIGRVKVRVPQLHGVDSTDISPEDLPWAYPSFSFGSGYDHGSLVVPEVGDYVWIGFEAGDPNKPVYLGGVGYGIGPNSPKDMGSYDKSDSSTYSDSKGYWYSPAMQSESIKDAYVNNEPTQRVIYKSPKGHTIKVEDADERESISIIDRLGQILKFISPVTKEKNSYNGSSRGIANADEGTQLDTEEFSFLKKAVVLFRDASRQLFRMVSQKNKNKIELVSKNDEVHEGKLLRDTGLVLKTYDNDTRFKLFGENRDLKKSISLEGSVDDSQFTINIGEDGKVVSQLVISSNGSKLQVKGDLEINADNIVFGKTPYVSEKEVDSQDIGEEWKDDKDEIYKEGDE